MMYVVYTKVVNIVCYTLQLLLNIWFTNTFTSLIYNFGALGIYWFDINQNNCQHLDVNKYPFIFFNFVYFCDNITFY